MENELNHHIGNDLVAFPQQGRTPKYQNQRWLDKVFTKSEQAFILNATEPEQTLWWFWSCKESAYKVFIKIEKIRKFNPKEIEIKTMNAALKQTTIQYKSWSVWTTTSIQTNYLHTIAVTSIKLLNLVNHQVFEWNDLSTIKGSQQLKMALIQDISLTQKQDVVIFKDEWNIPRCKTKDTIIIEVSFSHDNSLFAYCWLLLQNPSFL